MKNRGIIRKISTRTIPKEFLEWLRGFRDSKCEVVVSKGIISHVYVNTLYTEDWSNIKNGRIIISEGLKIRQDVYKPILINGKFVENYDED